MSEKLISVIIPVYNAEKHMKKAIDSVVNQSYKNLEIILVDDGSKDAGGAICDEYAQTDNRVKVIHKENNGLAEARNSGMDVAKGDYVVFCDSDDYVEPDMYEMMLNTIEKYDTDMVICEYVQENEDGTLVFQKSFDGAVTELDRTTCLKYLCSMEDGFGYAWNKLYKAEKIKDIRYKKEDGCSEDICFNYEFVTKNNRFSFINKFGYHYVMHEGSITKGVFCDNAFSIVKATKRFMEEQKENNEVYPFAVKGYTDAAYTVLSGVITSGICTERYDELRDGIISCKNIMWHGGRHSLKDKVKLVILSTSKTLYNFMIHKVRNK